MSNFINDALRTKSDKFYAASASRYSFEETLNELISSGNDLDKFKKLLYYNRLEGTESAQFQGNYNTDKSLSGIDDKIPVDVLHGILGIATESIELLEAIRKTLESGEKLDLVNVKEELGDVFWYQAILANALDTTFDKEQDRVIAKLKARFPDKFTEDQANDRNLTQERRVLENEQ